MTVLQMYTLSSVLLIINNSSIMAKKKQFYFLNLTQFKVVNAVKVVIYL